MNLGSQIRIFANLWTWFTGSVFWRICELFSTGSRISRICEPRSQVTPSLGKMNLWTVFLATSLLAKTLVVETINTNCLSNPDCLHIEFISKMHRGAVPNSNLRVYTVQLFFFRLVKVDSTEKWGKLDEKGVLRAQRRFLEKCTRKILRASVEHARS